MLTQRNTLVVFLLFIVFSFVLVVGLPASVGSARYITPTATNVVKTPEPTATTKPPTSTTVPTSTLVVPTATTVPSATATPKIKKTDSRKTKEATATATLGVYTPVPTSDVCNICLEERRQADALERIAAVLEKFVDFFISVFGKK